MSRDSVLVQTFRLAMDMRAEMRTQGATDTQVAAALEKTLRAALTAVPEAEWPYWARVPRCMHCDGYGLVMRRVENRLRLMVDEGTPCTCMAGAKFFPKSPADADFTEAGKTAKPQRKGFQRWNG